MLGDTSVELSVLLDSGALHANYISKKFIDEWLPLPITLTRNGVPTTDVITFGVLQSCSQDAIIGLPGIFYSFFDLFVGCLQDARSLLMCPKSDNISPSSLDLAALDLEPSFDPPGDMTGLIEPWQLLPEEDAPEDDDISNPLPCMFTDYLNYMEMGYDESVQEFLEMLESRISPEFAAATDIINFLRTEGLSVFVPEKWEGIKGVPDIEFEFLPDTPLSNRTQARPVNPKLTAAVDIEIDRLLTYLFMISTSPYASPLVVAPKKTKPFIRICGDYTKINRYIVLPSRPIPNIPHELDKLQGYKYFADIDLANSFHQFRLAPRTRRYLALKTQRGLFEPVFMPEGVPPASGVLQEVMEMIFGGQPWTLVAFDNLSVMANTYDELFERVCWVIRRAKEFNVVLKLSKTWLGFASMEWFGYVCREGYHELSPKRIQSIVDLPFPTSLKEMQRFLGMAIFCHRFVPNFSDHTAVLNSMTHKDVNWKDKSTWPEGHLEAFDSFKEALCNNAKLYYPDYSLDWVLQVDASQYGVGAAMFMVQTLPDGSTQLLPLSFASQLFSPQAKNWSTIEQECYAIVYAFKHFSYYLRAKAVILESDHANLLWMESSTVPKIVRWKIFLQQFTFWLRHIPGRLNVSADYLSRLHQSLDAIDELEEESFVDVLTMLAEHFATVESKTSPLLALATSDPEPAPAPPALAVPAPVHPPEYYLRQIHGDRMGHPGINTTMERLDRYYQGHKIPYSVVRDFVLGCPICQKARLAMTSHITPLIRNIRPMGKRIVLGLDFLTITPPDKDGNVHILTAVNHHSKHCWGYKSKTKDAISCAVAAFQYICSYGLPDCIYSDPGSEFTSEVVRHLNKWLGIAHVISIVDRHESNGVEGTNKKILRHLRALVFDERILNHWGDPHVLPLIFYFINSEINSETGTSPLVHMFGTDKARYFNIGKELDLPENAHEFVKQLDADLRVIDELSKAHQQAIIDKRTGPLTLDNRNEFQPGDFVLYQENPEHRLPYKLYPKYRGPYEVIYHRSNDVQCRHLNLGEVREFHVSTLKRFYGTLEDAVATARIDRDQHTIRAITGFTGDPWTRTTMSFEVHFEDGTVLWKPYDDDLFQTVQYERFCTTHRMLRPLLIKAALALLNVAEVNKVNIDDVHKGTTARPGMIFYLDLRNFGFAWYDTLSLPDPIHTSYVFRCTYTMWNNTRSHRKIVVRVDLTNESLIFTHYDVLQWGTAYEFTSGMVLIDKEFVRDYPFVVSPESANILQQ